MCCSVEEGSAESLAAGGHQAAAGGGHGDRGQPGDQSQRRSWSRDLVLISDWPGLAAPLPARPLPEPQLLQPPPAAVLLPPAPDPEVILPRRPRHPGAAARHSVPAQLAVCARPAPLQPQAWPPHPP